MLEKILYKIEHGIDIGYIEYDWFVSYIIALEEENERLKAELNNLKPLKEAREQVIEYVRRKNGEKKIPEKLDLYEETQKIIRENNYKLVYHDIHKCIVSLECKYNQLIDYLNSKGDE